MVNREIFSAQDPRCPFLFLSFQLHPRQDVCVNSGNWHKNLEILSFTEGSATVVCGDELLHVAGGDTVIINSNLIHTIISKDCYTSYTCLHIGIDFCEENCIDMDTMRFENLIRNQELSDLMAELHREYPAANDNKYRVLTEDDSTMERIVMRRAIVMRILAILYCSYRLPETEATPESHRHEGIKRALEYIYAQCYRDISLDEIAQVAGMSKYYFAREFRRVTQYSFVSYVNSVRCEHAKRLLFERKLPIREIGRQCGFSDQSYFSRTFVNLVGISPSEYRKRAKTDA